MTREELTEKICPTDATYECGQGDCTSNCNDCNELLNALLDEYDKQIRADAIEEYRLALHKKYADNKYLYESNMEYWNLDMEEVDEIAKQLKEQK